MLKEMLSFRRERKEINKQAAVELVTSVRDVPFVLGADGNIERLFEDNISGCVRKHLYLFPRLQQLGYKVEIGITQFNWRELPIPDYILSLLKQPVQHHMFLYVGNDTPDTWLTEMRSCNRL